MSNRKINWDEKREEHVMELFAQCVLNCRKGKMMGKLNPANNEFEKDMAHYVAAGLLFGNIDDGLTASGLSKTECPKEFIEVRNNVLKYIWKDVYGINKINDIEACLTELRGVSYDFFIDEDVEEFWNRDDI